MISLKILIIGAAVCFTQITAEHKVLSKSRYFSESDIVVDWNFFDQDHLTYLLCDETPIIPERKCTITREYADEKKSSCELNLQFDSMGSRPKVVTFGEDKAIIISINGSEELSSYRIFTTIDMTTCEKKEVSIRIPKEDKEKFAIATFMVSVLTYDGSFEAIFPSDICGEKFCKISFDQDGNRINDSAEWIPHNGVKVFFAHQLPSNSSSRKYLLYADTDKEDQKLKTYLVENEHVKTLIETEGSRSFSTSGSSVANNMTTVCIKVTDRNGKGIRTKCAQFVKDEKKFEVELVAEKEDYMMFIENSIHNLPGGGFLIATVSPDIQRAAGPNKETYTIKKFDKNGKLSGSVKYTGFDCKWEGYFMFTRFTESKTGKYCLSILCTEMIDAYKDRNHLDIDTSCYTDNDFYL